MKKRRNIPSVFTKRFLVSGTWGNWVRVKLRRRRKEGYAICYVGNQEYIVVEWDGQREPELLPASALVHRGYWHNDKRWHSFAERKK